MAADRTSTGLGEGTRSMLAGVAASGVYLGAAHGLAMPSPTVLFALVLALGTYVGVMLLLPRRRSLTEQLADLGGEWQGDNEHVAAVIEDCRQRVERLRAARADLPADLGERAEGVITGAERVIDGFLDDPGDVARSAQFERYLAASVDIVEKCAELASKGGGEKVEAVIARSYQVLGEIEQVFEKQYQRNLSNEVLDLDVDLDVLTRTIKSEGL